MQAHLKIDTRPRAFIPKRQNGTEGYRQRNWRGNKMLLQIKAVNVRKKSWQPAVKQGFFPTSQHYRKAVWHYINFAAALDKPPICALL